MMHKLGDTLQEEFERFQKEGWPCVHIASQEQLGDFNPPTEICHDRAKLWTEKHPCYKVVPGWIADAEGVYDKHSVVADPTGALICVTFGPRDRTLHRFIVHREDWGPFTSFPVQVSPP